VVAAWCVARTVGRAIDGLELQLVRPAAAANDPVFAPGVAAAPSVELEPAAQDALGATLAPGVTLGYPLAGDPPPARSCAACARARRAAQRFFYLFRKPPPGRIMWQPPHDQPGERH
jgi:hypothetical protein